LSELRGSIIAVARTLPGVEQQLPVPSGPSILFRDGYALWRPKSKLLRVSAASHCPPAIEEFFRT